VTEIVSTVVMCNGAKQLSFHEGQNDNLMKHFSYNNFDFECEYKHSFTMATERQSYVYDVSEDGFHDVLLCLLCGVRLLRVVLIISTEERHRVGLLRFVSLYIV
jgi:hypothetical protein